jgi:hypothetical protein
MRKYNLAIQFIALTMLPSLSTLALAQNDPDLPDFEDIPNIPDTTPSSPPAPPAPPLPAKSIQLNKIISLGDNQQQTNAPSSDDQAPPPAPVVNYPGVINLDSPVKQDHPVYSFKKVIPQYSGTFEKVEALNSQYNGFTVIKFSQHSPEEKSLAKTLQKIAFNQLDQVLNLKIDASFIDYFKGFPIALTTENEQLGHYNANSDKVEISLASLNDAKSPVILSGLLEAYYSNLDSDTNNQDNLTVKKNIDDSFERAKTHVCDDDKQSSKKICFAPDAEMLESATSYFAITASIILAGPRQTEPFNAAKIRATDPAYATFLSKLFSPANSQKYSSLK